MKFEVLAGIVGVFSISGILMALSGSGGRDTPREEISHSAPDPRANPPEEKIEFQREKVGYSNNA